MIKLQFNLHTTFLGLGIFIGLLNFFQLLCARQACYHSICSKLPFFICNQMGSSNVECIWFSRRTYQGNCVVQLMGCKHAKVSQFMNFLFLSEIAIKININIKNYKIYFNVMINMKMFFEFNIILLCFIFSMCNLSRFNANKCLKLISNRWFFFFY
jgi:hypothetical protein